MPHEAHSTEVDHSEVEHWLTETLGPWQVCGVLTKNSGRVFHIEDRQRNPWVVKTAATQTRWAAEVRAYRRWVPHFADQAPALRAASQRLRTLVLEHVPGVADWTFDPADHHAAGRLLRRIHECEPPSADGPDIGKATATRLRASLRSLPPSILDWSERLVAEGAVVRLQREFGHLPRVPTHGDFGGHNWLRSPEGIRIIDFESAARRVAALDFARLWIGPWWERPDLATAFFDGYGRPMTDEEHACVRLQLPAFAISLVSHGRRHGDLDSVRRGRHRLAQLVDGADYTRFPTGVRGLYHATRRTEGRLRGRLLSNCEPLDRGI